MAYKYYDKEKAKELFIQGYNLSEISTLLKINKTSRFKDNSKTTDY